MPQPALDQPIIWANCWVLPIPGEVASLDLSLDLHVSPPWTQGTIAAVRNSSTLAVRLPGAGQPLRAEFARALGLCPVVLFGVMSKGLAGGLLVARSGTFSVLDTVTVSNQNMAHGFSRVKKLLGIKKNVTAIYK